MNRPAVPVPRSTGWTSGVEHLCLGVSWASGFAELLSTTIDGPDLVRLPLRGHRLSFRTGAPGRFCVGRHTSTKKAGGPLPCPLRAPALHGSQCDHCYLRDEFRYAHQVHRGGYVPEALSAYLSQPHWLYIATFADGVSKVGTAADPRKQTRLDEQGAVRATYVAYATDGVSVRHAEDAVSDQLGIPQLRHRAAKVRALTDPAPPAHVDAEHSSVVASVADLLAHRRWGAAVAAVHERWHPLADAHPFIQSHSGKWITYPHSLLVGEHGFHIDACCGPAALARTDLGPDGVRFVVDLGQLKGAQVIPGSFVSPATEVQESLF